MTWMLEVQDEFEKGGLKSLVERAELMLPDDPTTGKIEDAVRRAIDEGCTHNQLLLEIVLYYGFASEAFDLAYEDLFADMCERLEA